MKDIRIVLLGFGNVAQAVLRLLEENDSYRAEGVTLSLHSVFDRGGGIRVDANRAPALIAAKREGKTVASLAGAARITLQEALDETRGEGILVDSSITNADTGGPGLGPARQALERGTPVVFASKGPLVAAFDELSALARANGARLGASAAVGIPLPSLEVGALGLRGARVRRFRGILNDTTNQFFRDLEAGIPLEDSIAKARLAGTIEEDPRLDLEGWDAAYKLLILARVLWNPKLSLADGGDPRGLLRRPGRHRRGESEGMAHPARGDRRADRRGRGSSTHRAGVPRDLRPVFFPGTGGKINRFRNLVHGNHRPSQQSRRPRRDRSLCHQGRPESGFAPETVFRLEETRLGQSLGRSAPPEHRVVLEQAKGRRHLSLLDSRADSEGHSPRPDLESGCW